MCANPISHTKNGVLEYKIHEIDKNKHLSMQAYLRWL